MVRKRSTEAWERRISKQEERIKAIRAKYGKASSPDQQHSSISAVPTPTVPTPKPTTASPSISNASNKPNKKSNRKRSKEALERRAAKQRERIKAIRESYRKALSPNQQPESISAAPTPTLITEVSAVEDSLATAPSFSNASQQSNLTSITQDPTTRDSPVAGPSNSDVNQQPKSAPTQDEDAAQES
ncbi:hypothetical protein V502_06156 [Pseudogymnoascus sp. VKM F-4520 (FW-2644)]|nr:hypothetical protein V502_06156 [Pseudogymnoascus sp. VKM F-4520 (FW-2644)]